MNLWSFLSHLRWQEERLYCEGVALDEIAAQFGTPCYVYSHAALEAALGAYQSVLAPVGGSVHYAVKANGNLALLRLIAEAGAGFDIVSGGELARVLAAGGPPSKVVFSGVGKRRDEIEAALEAGIEAFHVESAAELARLAEVARAHGVVVPVRLRVNPDIDPKTHPYISTGLAHSKFGVPIEEAKGCYRRMAEDTCFAIRGVACHIGSQMLDTAPLVAAAERMRAFVEALETEGIALPTVDLGGGIGIPYRPDDPIPDIAATLRAMIAVFADKPQRLAVEPGRSIVGGAGVLLTRVEYLKTTPAARFAIVDAAMNDLMRPALYDAYHEVVSVVRRDGVPETSYDIVGPVCESGDFLAKQRRLALAEGDVLALLCAGAYGASMSSNYNTRARAPEVLVSGETVRLIRRRERLDALWADEIL